MRSAVMLVAWREVAEKVQNRAFLLFTAFVLLIPIGGGVVGAFASGPEIPEYTVGLTGGDSELVGAALEERAPAFAGKVELERFGGGRAAERAVKDGEVDAAVVGTDRVLADGRPGADLQALLQSSAQRARTVEALRAAGTPPSEARAALDPEPLDFEDVGGGGGEGGIGPEVLVAQVGMVLLFVTVFTYGYWIANGVVEEKSSRVVEVVLSAVRPSRLLVGKVVGIGLLGLCQILLVAGVSLVSVSVFGPDLPPVALGILGAVVLWFVLGFAFYGYLFAVAGSLVSKQEDLQYTQLPVMVLIFVGYGIAFYAFGNPGSPAVEALSFVPPFSPMVMLMRMGLGEVGALQVVATALLTMASAAGLTVLAARLYAGSVLRFGARVPLREAWGSRGSR